MIRRVVVLMAAIIALTGSLTACKPFGEGKPTTKDLGPTLAVSVQPDYRFSMNCDVTMAKAELNPAIEALPCIDFQEGKAIFVESWEPMKYVDLKECPNKYGQYPPCYWHNTTDRNEYQFLVYLY